MHGTYALIIALITSLTLTPMALALDRVRLITNWRAEAEHGGFYQAIMDGTYARYGIAVELQQGGPQLNSQILLAAGRVDFALGSNSMQIFEAVRQNTPIVAVAGIFQFEPIALMSHPGEGLDRFEDLSKANAYVSSSFLVSAWRWLKSAYGFRDEKLRNYTFNSAPFIADKKSIQQAYLTSEPYAIEKQGGFKPNIFRLIDYGYDSYGTTIETRADLIEKNPDLVQRFVDASIIGWDHYLHGDNAAANAAIKRDNPEMTDGQLAFSIDAIREHGLVDSGDASTQGIGAMNDARIAAYYEKMVAVGVLPAGIDYRKGYTLRFIGKKVGRQPVSGQ
jgi:NitT/TauT family transport system substrate-binding protein